MKMHGTVKNDTLKIRKGFLSEEEWKQLEISWDQARNGDVAAFSAVCGIVDSKVKAIVKSRFKREMLKRGGMPRNVKFACQTSRSTMSAHIIRAQSKTEKRLLIDGVPSLVEG
jgi:hypothetical protein